MESKSETLVIGAGGTLRLPAEVLERAHLSEGSVVSVSVLEDGVVAICDPSRDPEWMARPEWAEGLGQALADVAEGRTQYFASDEEFRAAIVARSKP